MMKTDYKFKALPKPAQRHVRIYQFQQALSWGGFGLTIVVLVLLLQERGFSLFDIGLITATYSGTALLFELPLGGLADGIGRKPVFVMSVFVEIAGLLILLYFRTFEAALLSYAFYGLGRALSSGSLGAWYIETFRKLAPNFGTVPILAKIQFGGAMGLAVGAIFGGLIADYFGPKMPAYGYGIYDAPLIANFVVSIFMLVYTILYIKEDRQALNLQAIKNGFSNVPIIMRESLHYAVGHRIISILLMSAGMISLGFFAIETYWIPFAKPMIESQYAIFIIGIITSIYFFSLAFGAAIAAPIVNLFKGHNAWALIFLTALAGLFFVGLSMAENIYIFTLVLVLMNIFKGAQGAPSESLFHDYVPDNKRSTLLSLQSVIGQLGGLIGMLGLGYIAEKYSIGTAWKIGGLIVIVSALVLLVLPNRMASTPVVSHDED